MIKGLRRSLKGEKRTSSASSVSTPDNAGLTTKSKLATIPPKKIIRALYDYNAQGPGELTFAKGDFLYVVGNENDVDWYEAWDPPSDLHGMVPVAYFEVVQRQESISTIPLATIAKGGATIVDKTTPRSSQASRQGSLLKHKITRSTDSGGAPSISAPSISAPSMSARSVSRSASVQRASRTSSEKAYSPLYGVVLYDFQAERPDELDASKGESIIVIAQSTEEWFVAKPIGRLGGPGLIPISYVQIREVGTGRPVEDVHGAIKEAGVPRVEEWKRMAAEYKASSIPLGKFDDPGAVARQVSQLSLQQSERDRHRSAGTTSSADAGEPVSARQSITPYVTNASVDRYAFDGGRYWYLVIAELSNGKYRNLCRYYQDFYDFQIKLLDEFPDEAGRTGKLRTLPFMPGPLTYVNDSISSQRRANLDEYVRNLIMMPAHVSRSPIVQQLFSLRTGDVETPHPTNTMPQPPTREASTPMQETVAPSASSSTHALHQQQQQSSQSQFNGLAPHGDYFQEVPPETQVNHSSHSLNKYASEHSGGTLNSPLEAVPAKIHSHGRMASESTVTPVSQDPNALSRDIPSAANGGADDTLIPDEAASSTAYQSTAGFMGVSRGPASTVTSVTAFDSKKSGDSIKVKVFFHDDLIAIRVPGNVTFASLYQKISQRLGLQSEGLYYKDEVSGDLTQISNDNEFAEALGERAKIVLYAR